VTHVSRAASSKGRQDSMASQTKTQRRETLTSYLTACSGGSSEGVAVCDEGETLDEVEDQNETSFEEQVSSPALGAASGPSLWVSWTCPARMIHHCTKIDSGVSTNTLKPSPPLCKLPS